MEFGNDIIGQFKGCSNLDITATDSPVIGNTLRECFSGCTSLSGGFSEFDTTSVADMEDMFNGCTNLYNADFTKWCVSQIAVEPTGFATNAGFSERPAWSQPCNEHENSKQIDGGIATSTSPYTRGGMTICGFQDGATISFADLDTSISVPDKMYACATNDNSIVGYINTEFSITNNKIRYTDPSGQLYEFYLQNAGSGVNIISEV